MLFQRKVEIVQSLKQESPTIRANIPRFQKEWVQDENGKDFIAVLKRVYKCRIIVKPQSFPKPIYRIVSILQFAFK
jgi:hypothetical protein